ncbi:MAG TPA: methyltransferase domain-containing protein [Opitutaceae bacterium]|nr:methyltransferase domain-containing protein [Opitutaceae bacterium]
MCVLNDTITLAPPATADALVARYFPTAPGTLAALEAGATFLLTGCGEGHGVHELARRFPRSLFAGIDDSDRNIVLARRQALSCSLANVWFEAGNIATHRFGGIFHFVASLEDDARSLPLLRRLASLHGSLRRDGVLFFQPPPGAVSHRLLEAGFATVRSVTFADDPERPLYLARR